MCKLLYGKNEPPTVTWSMHIKVPYEPGTVPCASHSYLIFTTPCDVGIGHGILCFLSVPYFDWRAFSIPFYPIIYLPNLGSTCYVLHTMDRIKQDRQCFLTGMSIC